ncbi:MAG: protein-L-isoaspartate O-methyltransferase [Gammaproteobacteria bacterium]
MNFHTAQINMLKQQIRTWDVLDDKILALFARVPREPFVPAPFRELAYADTAIPIGHGQVIPPPKEMARILQALHILSSDTILEIGTGSGYFTALLAGLGQHVESVDVYPDFTERAHQTLQTLDVTNVTLHTGDALQGWDKPKSYAVILLNGSVPYLPESLRNNLALGGRLLAVVGFSPVMEVTLFEQFAPGQWRTEFLFETDWPRLPNVGQYKPFVF